MIAHSYSNIFNLPCTGLRFFTVYGPYGRPDMSLYKFIDATFKNKILELFNNGNHTRDFTYIDDVIISLTKLMYKKSKKRIPYQIFNICNDNPVKLKKYLNIIFKILQKKTKVSNLSLQIGDVKKTWGSNAKLKNKIQFSPKTNIEFGINKFIEWYKKYYKIK